MKKRILALVLCFLIMRASFAAFAQPIRSFTDDAGRSVVLPTQIQRIAVTGQMSQIAILAIAPDMLVGVASAWDEEEKAYVPECCHDLPVLGQIYGGKGEWNPEQLLLLSPDLVIDIGETKGSLAQDLDRLSTQTGIPFVHVSSSLFTMDETYRKLGSILNRTDEGERLAAYCKAVCDRAVELSQKVEKADLLYLTAADGLGVIAKDSYHSEVIDLLGNNLAVVDSPSSKGTGNEIDLEQLLIWNPDYLLLAPGSVHELNGDAWQKLTAIRQGQILQVPYGPYNWLGFPPSSQRLLGMIWLGKMLYPEEAQYDLYQETAEYFKLFYHHELTREQFDELTAFVSR